MPALAFVSVLLAVFGALPAARAEHAPTLKVGDPAPKLQTGRWIQGDPVKEFLARKDLSGVRQVGNELMAHLNGEQLRGRVAAEILESQGLDKELVVYADKLAAQANEAAHGTNVWLLRTVVRADILLGRTEAAEVHEKEALAAAFTLDAASTWKGQGKMLASHFRSLHLDDFLLRKEYEGANQFLGEVGEQSSGDADTQNEIAWTLLTDPRLEVRDLELAESLATRASQVAIGS